MNKFSSKLGILLVVSFFLLVNFSESYGKPKKLLVVTVTKGYKHASIPVLTKVIDELGKSSKTFTVEYAGTDEELTSKMTAKSLQNYDGVVFASTTGDLPLPDKEAFLNWIKKGNAFIGIHSATDTFHGFQPFIEMIGGEFSAHGPQLKVTLNVNDGKHSAVKVFGKKYEIFDEIYVFKNFNRSNVRILISLDKHPNQNDKYFGTSGVFPIAWCREYGKGRVFYTALGHREDVIESEKFKKHLLGGIQWSLKKAKGNSKPNWK